MSHRTVSVSSAQIKSAGWNQETGYLVMLYLDKGVEIPFSSGNLQQDTRQAYNLALQYCQQENIYISPALRVHLHQSP